MAEQNWKFEDGYMTNNTSVPFAGVINGNRAKQGIYEQSSTPNYPIGHRIELPDGRIFRYASFGGAVNRGLLVSQDVSATSWGVLDGKLTAASAAATRVTVTSTATFGSVAANKAADTYAGGYLHLEDDTGEGYTYRVKSSTANTAAGAVSFDLYDGLIAAVTTNTDAALTGCMWKGVVAATTTDPLVCGLTMRTMTSGYYGWVQTWGPATCLAEIPSNATVAKGVEAYLDSTGTAGAAMAIAGVASGVTFNAGDVKTPRVGYFLYTGTDAAHVGVFLQISP